MRDTIRILIAEHGRLLVPIDTIDNEADLYAAGLNSFAAVQLLLALETRFNVAFPEHMLNPRSFVSVDAINRCVHALLRAAA